MNWDVNGDQTTQVRGGTGVFSGRPAYVWISNQLGNSGVLVGERIIDTTTAFPFNPNIDTYKPAPTGGGAASYAAQRHRLATSSSRRCGGAISPLTVNFPSAS